jgi:hypothetical protein
LTTLVIADGSPARFAVAALVTVPPHHHDSVVVLAQVETGDGEVIPGWALQEELRLGHGPDLMGSAALAGPVDVPCRPGSEIVIRMRFGEDERSVRFRTVAAGSLEEGRSC